jgi:hypothetical protein
VSSLDADLQYVIATWNALPDSIRKAVMALVETIAPYRESLETPANRMLAEKAEIKGK